MGNWCFASMKRTVFTAVYIISNLLFISGCSSNMENPEKEIIRDTVYIDKYSYSITPAYAYGGDFNRSYGDFHFKVTSIERDFRHDSVYIEIRSDVDTIIAEYKRIDCQIEEVLVRDLDSDDFPELYILGRSEGSAGFLCVDMYEASGDDLETGDLDKLYGIHKLTFTNKHAVHEQWLESYGIHRYVGIEFTYFVLENNQFKFVERSEWNHKDETSINQSFLQE